MQRYSKIFTKTRKNPPSDESSNNAKILIRAGFVYKEMAGVYAYLPLGIRVLQKITQIVREEMNAIGGEEIIMTTLQKPETWMTTNRWDDKMVDVWFKTKLKDNSDLGLAWSHEEAIIEMVKQHLDSYKDLPINVYQFQTKFRNELRAKSGIMRGREFVMKDMYSCSTDEAQHEKFYQESIKAYTKVFKRLGLGKETYLTFASGGAFTEYSHEFQTVCDAGEDYIYIDQEKNIAINEEVYNEKTIEHLGVNKNKLVKVKSAEVGNIFNFGTTKSKDTTFTFKDENNQDKYVHLGSYGIGITRAMGVVCEKYSDDRGVAWPASVAPYLVHFITLDEKHNTQAEKIINQIEKAGFDVLWDETESTAGEKFANADLIGCPVRILLSEKSLKSGGLEVKPRNSDNVEIVKESEIIKYLTKTLK